MEINIEGALPWMAWGFWDCRICKKKISNRAWHGHIDGIVTDLLANDRLYEHKGINHFTFQRYSKDTYPVDYFTQCALYLRGVRQDNPDLNEAVLLIKNKNTSAFLEYLLQYDAKTDTLRLLQMSFSEGGEIRPFDPPIEFPDITHSAEDRFRQVAEHVKAKTLPERPHEYGTDFPCGYCLVEGTKVKTQQGWQAIELLKEGDKVFSSNGLFNEVTHTFSRTPYEKLYTVKAFNLLPISATENHEFLVEEAAITGGNDKGVVKWLTLGKLNEQVQKRQKRYRLLYRIDNTTDPLLSMDKALLCLIGFYVTEGSMGRAHKNGQKYSVSFALHTKERAYVEQIRNAVKKHFNKGGKLISQKTVTDKRNGWRSLRVTVSSKALVDFLGKHVHLGKSHNKSLKEHLLRLPKKQVDYLLSILIKGDGCQTKTRNSPTTVYSTTSKKLALQVQEMFLRLDKIAGITMNKPSENHFGDKPCYHVRHYEDAPYHYGYIADSLLRVPVQYIKEISYNEKVYDITVKNTHDFLTEGGIVHNCQWEDTCWTSYIEELGAFSGNEADLTDIEDTARYYNELKAQESEIKEQKKEVRSALIKELAKREVSKGKAGEYMVKLSFQEKKSYTVKASTSQVLRVNRIKKKEYKR